MIKVEKTYHLGRVCMRIFCLTMLLLLAVPGLRAQFTIGGTASSLGSGCYQLTTSSNSQAGYVYQNAPLNLHESFDYKYRVYLGNNNGGADGIVFVLRGSLGNPYIGNGGGGLGFLNMSGNNVGGSVGVEVDTWQNGNYGDPTIDHIGIISQASPSHTAATALTTTVSASATTNNVEDGNWHTLNIRWDADAEELDVYFDCNYRLQYQGNLIDSMFNGDSLVHWGFVGTTGGANNVQRFCFTESIDSLFNPLDSHSICRGDTVQLDAGNSALSYSWSPSTGLSSNSSGTPDAYPVTTTNYVVTATYVCDTIIDTAHVEVLDPNFSVSASVTEPLCNGDCNGEVDITVNGTSTYTFDWTTGATTEDISNLCNGTYYVSVQDVDTGSASYLCYVWDTIEVDEPDVITATISNATDVSCPAANFCDASAVATGAGGTETFNFQWSTGEFTQQAQALCPDSNFVTVTDANGCDTTAWVVIDVPDSIVTIGLKDTTICISNLTNIRANSIGGTPPYSYIWTSDSLTGDTVSFNRSDWVGPVVDTRYFVVSTDSNNCPGDSSTIFVNVRPPLGGILEPTDTICPYDTIPIFVSGEGGDSLYNFTWENGALGPSTIVSPNSSRWYTVSVNDACGTPTYVDSVFVQVGGYEKIRASIRAEDDSLCVGENIYLIATGKGGHNGPNEYTYTWNQVSWEDKSHHFDTPLQTTTYIVTISDLCLSPEGSDTITVYVGGHSYPQFEAIPDSACAHADVAIVLNHYNPKYEYNWSLGDGWFEFDAQSDTIYHAYDETGCYDVGVNVRTPFDCYTERSEPCLVKVIEPPSANFGNDPLQPTTTDPILDFYDRSFNSARIEWWLDGELISEDSMFAHEFIDTGIYEMQLVAYSPEGCPDTTTHVLEHSLIQRLYLPNSFTPNGDGNNDEWGIIGEGVDLEDFELSIFDRWGREVFYSRNPNFKWDGTQRIDKRQAPIGTYHYTLRYLDQDNEQQKLTGKLMLVKSKDLE